MYHRQTILIFDFFFSLELERVIVIIVIVLNLATFCLSPSDSLTKWIGGNYFSFRRTRRDEITCRGDTLSQNFFNIIPLGSNPV